MMEVSGSELLRQSYEMLEKNEKLDLVMHNFNRLLNGTMHGKGEDMGVLLFYIACTHMKMGHHALAILLYKQAIDFRKDFVAAINNLGYVYKKEGMFEETKRCFEEVIRIVEEGKQEIPDSDKAEYYTNFGSLMIANGTPRKAIEYFDRAASISDHGALNKWNRSLAYLELGDYERGFLDYEQGDRSDLKSRRTYGKENLPDWDGTPGKRIIVYGEQGIGDEIMFSSMLPDAIRDCTVILDAHPRLADLFRLNYPGIAVYGTRKTEIKQIGWIKYHEFDSKIAIGSLAKYYRKKEEDFPKTPFLKCDPAISAKYRTILANMGNRPKIGISWKGGIKSTNSMHRQIPLESWAGILAIDADFISLQYHRDIGEEVRKFEGEYGAKLNHWQTVLDDYDETAGLVDNLDLIISVPQSVVHLAAAMGKTVWQLSPFRAMWQVGPYGREMPWYAATENFWQGDDCQWEPVMKRVEDRLCSLLAMSTES